MNLLFINLTGLQVWTIFLSILVLVLFAGFLAAKREKGVNQIFWLTGIVFVPPVFALFYLVKTFFASNKLSSSKM